MLIYSFVNSAFSPPSCLQASSLRAYAKHKKTEALAPQGLQPHGQPSQAIQTAVTKPPQIRPLTL